MDARPRFRVDFNECIDRNHVLLSRGDERPDWNGETVTLREGLEVVVFERDSPIDSPDTPEYLVGCGTVVPTPDTSWTKGVKWSCKFDENGVFRSSSPLRTDERL